MKELNLKLKSIIRQNYLDDFNIPFIELRGNRRNLNIFSNPFHYDLT